jgi:hypothetical protein
MGWNGAEIHSEVLPNPGPPAPSYFYPSRLETWQIFKTCIEKWSQIKNEYAIIPGVKTIPAS